VSQNRTKPRLIVLSGLQLKGQGSNLKYGELAERLKALVLKTRGPPGSVSSNLTLSAIISSEVPLSRDYRSYVVEGYAHTTLREGLDPLP